MRRLVCLFTVIICISASLSAQAVQTKKILIINSYHQGYEWTDEQSLSAVRYIGEMIPEATADVVFMDWKRFPTQENLDHFKEGLILKYSGMKIDLIMTTDDAALSFAVKYRDEFLSSAPIVFMGIFETSKDALTGGAPDCTGVFETVDIEGTLINAAHIFPGPRKLYILHDDSETSQSMKHNILSLISRMNTQFEPVVLEDLLLEDMTAALAAVEPSSVVLFASYARAKNNVVLQPEEFARRFTAVCPAPCLVLYAHMMGNGALGGNVLDGRLQGKTAAELARKIFDGADPDLLTPVSKNISVSSYDWNVMNRFNILPQQLPGGSVVNGKPFSFFEVYKTLVITVSVAFCLLTILVTGLIFNITKRMQTQKELSSANKELLASAELQKEHQRRINHLAYFDSLTGLPNRVQLQERAAALIADRDIARDRLCMLFIDMDNFKFINDAYGHLDGDELLIQTAQRISRSLPEASFAARLGGDEFVVILHGRECEKQLQPCIAEIYENFTSPFEVGKNIFFMTCSMGVARWPVDGTTYYELLKNADTALYFSKDTGKGRSVYFEPTMNTSIVERTTLQNYLRKALTDKEFELYYQPQTSSSSGSTIRGFEALVRWNSPDLGFTPPNKFIPACEESGYIVPLGEWILETACFKMKELIQAGFGTLIMSVNISVVQLAQSGFIQMVLNTVSKTGITPENLELEITESMLIESFDIFVTKIQELRSYGIKVALDDFGSGYSSLSYLRKLPISTLKIDKTFVDHIENDIESRSLVKSIIEIARNMHLEVIAEGIESDGQRIILDKQMCNWIQGYLVSRPMKEQDVMAFLKKADVL